MKHSINRAVAAMLCLACILAMLSGCAWKKPTLSETAISHEEEFGGVYIRTTIEDFNALGFAYGDSVDLRFSNGYVLEDLPYYNGYYTLSGDPLLVAYPGYPYIRAGINNGDDLWVLAGLQETDTAEITLHKRGAYSAIQSARDITYTDDRSQYASDAVFANFRAVRAGEISENALFRSASPCDNQHNRATYVDALIRTAGVNCILNLADTPEKIEAYLAASDFSESYFLPLYDGGHVIPVALNMNYTSETFKTKIAAGLAEMITQSGPYLVHCTEGKDRTGFVCLLLEALCGASYEEIEADYMITYDNYYGITKESDAARYDVIVTTVLLPMVESILPTGALDVAAADLSAGATQYLLDGGMTAEQIEVLKVLLTAAG